MTTDTIRQLLSHPDGYRRDAWRDFLKALFPTAEIFAAPQPLTHPGEELPDGFQLGRAMLADGRRIAFIEQPVPASTNLMRNRVGLRNRIARLIDQESATGVLAIFTDAKDRNFRLSFVARESSLTFTDEGTQTTKTETAPKRFTYYLGPDEACRTASERLAFLATHQQAVSLVHVIDAFSVEKLNKEFFDAYRNHYRCFCDHLLASDAPVRVFGLVLDNLEGKTRDWALKPVRDFVKKLLGRIVFLHFLQKKAWLGCPVGVAVGVPASAGPPAEPAKAGTPTPTWHGGDPRFLLSLFEAAPAPEHFHSRCLAPLFFDTLNNPHRPGDLFALTGSCVPYLNGGLFERDFPGVDAVDFPAPLFAGLLEFFGQYSFTIDENDPDDQEIGIDPEMLSHIFENLLEDNKDKGAYYTPKAVVQYMCQQSLIHALCSHFPDDAAARDEIGQLIRAKEPINPHNKKSWLARHATQLEQILDSLKICDPAIGSGAFPIGLLKEIFWTKLTLHPGANRAVIKRTIIQNSIHGVDLDGGAVEIARLRFWLALIVDEEEPLPLPNLDYQIMQGNSLLESFEGIDLSHLSQPARIGIQLIGSAQGELGFMTEQTELTVSTPPQADLAALQQDYFDCHDPEEKARLRARIDGAVLRAIDFEIERRREVLSATLDNWTREIARKKRANKGKYDPTPTEEKKRAVWQAELTALTATSTRLHLLLSNPRAERPFFLWHLWFREIFAAGGFDIVIANPPYVRQEAIKDQKPALKAEPYECFNGVADLLVYFYERAVKLLCPGGVLSFITSNKYYRAGYGEGLRAFLTRELTLHRLIDFGDAPVFDAIAYASILEGVKTPPPPDSSALVYTWEKQMPLDNIEPVIAQRGQPIRQSELTPDSWRLESPAVLRLLAKLRANGTPLGQYVNGRCYWGIKTGFNEAFVVDLVTRDRLISEHPSSATVLKPLLRGKDVKRWDVEFAERYLITIESSANATHPWSAKKAGDAERIFAKTYPGIHRWFDQFHDELKKREDQGVHFWELRSCAYWHEFVGQKLIVPAISGAVNVALDSNGYLSNNKTSIYVCDNAPFVSAVVNSSVAFWFARQVFGTKQAGFYDFEPRYSSQWPIPAATPAEQARLTQLVDRILAAKRAGDAAQVEALEAEIDTHVFRLYGLTPEETALIQAKP